MKKKTLSPISAYQRLLQQSQKEKDQQALEFMVEEAQQQLQADILATKRSLAFKKKESLFALSAQTFNASNILNFQIEVEGLEDGLKRLEKLQSDLF